jgi:hypothetical protein
MIAQFSRVIAVVGLCAGVSLVAACSGGGVTSPPGPRPSTQPSATPSGTPKPTPSPRPTPTATPTATPTGGPSGAHLYVSNYQGGSEALGEIAVYASDARGDAAPLWALSGSDTGLSYPEGIALDDRGELFVANYNDTVTVYASGAKDDAAPVRTLAGTRTGLSYPVGIAVDGAGDAFVVNSNNTVTIYAAGADGNIAPERTISGSQTKLRACDAIAIDASGAIYVANLGAGGAPSVTVYAAGANGDVAPTATISGDQTGLHIPTGIAVDASGEVIVSNYNQSVTVFAAGASGDAQPIRTLHGARTQLDANYGVAVAKLGPIFVTNQGLTSGPYSVTAYASDATGNVAPLRTITGSKTGLVVPNGIAVH